MGWCRGMVSVPGGRRDCRAMEMGEKRDGEMVNMAGDYDSPGFWIKSGTTQTWYGDLYIELACPSIPHGHAKKSENVEEGARGICHIRALSHRLSTLKPSRIESHNP